MEKTVKINKKILRCESYDLEVGGIVKSEGIKKGVVQVKVRGNEGRKELMFVTVELSELIRVFSEDFKSISDEGKLEKS